MVDIHHFSYGILTPFLAYVMSCTGAALGLSCTSRARAVTGRARSRWLVLGAISIGGTGIWVMHFIAMLGFTVPGLPIRYGVLATVASALIAVLVVGFGLFIVGFGGNRVPALLFGGLFAGLGVASMHYLGMYAMHLPGTVHYDGIRVLQSVIIAVVAATVALWFTLRVRGVAATTFATLLMGVAVCGMHYTGMSAMRVFHNGTEAAPHGASAGQLLVPLIMGISVVTVVLTLIVGIWPSEDEMRDEAELDAALEAHRLARTRLG